jgi:putative glutamine transport system substrate-binding protein
MKKFTTILTLLSLVLAFTGCDLFKKSKTQSPAVVASTNIQTIKDRDVLIVGVKSDTYKFGYQDPYTGIIDGFDVDIAKVMAKKILGSEKKLKLVPINAVTRVAMLNNDEIDYAIATFVITEERKSLYNFSSPYFTDDGIGCMVWKESGIGKISELDGKKVGVGKSTSAIKAMQDAAKVLNINITLVELDTYPDVKEALNAGEVDCFATNSVILRSYLDNNVVLLDDRLTPQPYGVVSKKGNNELTKVANDIIHELNLSGEMNKIVAKWGLK